MSVTDLWWPEPTISSQTIAINHIEIRSTRTFDEVRRKLEEIVPQLDRTIAAALKEGDQARAQDYGNHGPKLSIFLVAITARYCRLLARPARHFSTRSVIL